MKIGYARVSTLTQNINLQTDALEKAGCTKIVSEQASGSVANRTELLNIKECLRDGDTLIVWRLDRLGRSLKDLIQWIDWLEQNNILFRSISEGIDTSTSTGKLFVHMFGALAEFEHNLIKERTKAGLEAARVRGREGGRPFKLSPEKRQLAVNLYKAQKHSLKQICELVGVSKPTLYKYVNIIE
ncbi:MAG: recombinase family protein [Vicingaceae bacterium]|jgi:DNA invertase Pin-like site-specific DNA recombinase